MEAHARRFAVSTTPVGLSVTLPEDEPTSAPVAPVTPKSAPVTPKAAVVASKVAPTSEKPKAPLPSFKKKSETQSKVADNAVRASLAH